MYTIRLHCIIVILQCATWPSILDYVSGFCVPLISIKYKCLHQNVHTHTYVLRYWSRKRERIVTRVTIDSTRVAFYKECGTRFCFVFLIWLFCPADTQPRNFRHRRRITIWYYRLAAVVAIVDRFINLRLTLGGSPHRCGWILFSFFQMLFAAYRRLHIWMRWVELVCVCVSQPIYHYIETQTMPISFTSWSLRRATSTDAAQRSDPTLKMDGLTWRYLPLPQPEDG